MSDLRELSLRLNDVLEMVGVTEEMRSYHRRRSRLHEILFMIYMKCNAGEVYNVYQCGSSWEATVTPDLASDVDLIYCISVPLVVPHRLMAGPGWFLLAVRDDWTHPGYVKLQLIRDGQPLTVHDGAESDDVGFDGEGRACRKRVGITDGIMHGPACMLVGIEGRHYADRVFAFQCKSTPLFATDWITRHRPYNWPSKQLICEMKLKGCLFVCVGHFESRDKDLEWRLSFSLQERMMMKSLNITQHRVYVLLKMIKRDVLEKRLNQESISSYHCKTCVFDMAEKTPASMWAPENIINCLLHCLTLLLRWIKDRFCPSFFLKDSNLFNKDGFQGLAGPLEKLITVLLQTGHKFLYLLQSDRVGELLGGGELMLYKPVLDFNINKYVFHIDRSSISLMVCVFRHVSNSQNGIHDPISLYVSELEEFQHADCFHGYTEEEYRTALRHTLPWLHLSIGLEFAARAVTCPDTHEGKELMKKADLHLQRARNTDLVNVRLAKATILLRLEKLEECFKLLQELENCWTCGVIVHCPCSLPGGAVMVLQTVQQFCDIAAANRNMSLTKLKRTRFTSCVIFHRSQVELAPPPLRFEMYRSFYTRPGSRDEMMDDWFDRAAVDSKVYLYLLQCTVCSKLNREHQKQIAMDNLSSITRHDTHRVLGHRDTAFNLLGWMYHQENRVADALWCFLQSWKLRPHHNAAKFHVVVIIYKMVEELERKQNDI